MCILDETDLGLDVDAMKLVAEGVNVSKGRAVFPGYHYWSTAGSYQTRCRAYHGRRAHHQIRRAGAGAEVENNGYADLLAEGI